MPFSHEIVESYDRLKGALVKILESQSPEISIAKQYAQPLLILETPSDLAGFAVVNGEPEPAFFSAYESFKHIYRERHKAWKERNLSFVVCRSDANPERDSFFNVLETDVYFCRKYIVHLYSDQDKLEQDLRRLPFLPLPEGHAGGVTRPPSAQTLLQSLRLGAQLSRQIIVPQEHSAGRIIDELLARREPLPELNLGMDMTLQQQLEPTERSRVKNVSIEGFRAYKKKQEFDLNADVVVLFGPNGLGKTSFFDALDYVCTGRIGRFCRRRISQTDFAAIACHLATTPREARVLMLVDQGDKGYKVERSLDDWSTALINDQEFDRSSTLQLITSSQWGTNRARIENLERLFRATHLFGQSDQEFFTEFEQSSSLSPELVHRMLALDDYASGLAKAAAVLNELDKRIDGRKGEIGSLGQEIQRVQSQIQALPEAVEETTQSDTQLSGIVNRLVADLQSAGVLIEEVKPSKVSVRNWRAMTESALKDAEDRLLRLKRIEAGFAQHVANESTLKSVSGQLSKLLVYTKERTDEHRRQREQRDKLMDRFKKEQSILSRAMVYPHFRAFGAKVIPQ